MAGIRAVVGRWPVRLRIAGVFAALFLAGNALALEWLSARQRLLVEESLSNSQLALTQAVARELDSRISLQIQAAERAARRLSPALAAGPAVMGEWLDNLVGVTDLFADGFMVADPAGRVIGESPARGRLGGDLSSRVSFRQARDGAMVGLSHPHPGRGAEDPVVDLSLPIIGPGGAVLGVLSASLHLLDDRLLGALLDRRIGQSGYFYVVSVPARVIVATQFRSRVLEPLPGAGINPMLDRFVAGFQGAGISVNSRGVEMLVAAQRLESTGWILVSALPTAEAFQSVTAMKRQLTLALAVLALAALVLLWAVLGGFLRPLSVATTAIRDMVAGRRAFGPLPGPKTGEVAALVAGFNELQAQVEQAQAQTAANAERIQAVFSASPVGLAFVTLDRVLVAVNPVFCAIFNLPEAALLGQSTRILYGDDDEFGGIGRIFYRALAEGQPVAADVAVAPPGGGRKWLRMYAAPLDSIQPGRGAVFSVEDITRQVELERHLETSEARYRLLVEGVGDYAIFSVDVDGRIASWNSGAERIKGFRADEVIGLSVSLFYPPEDVAADKPGRLLLQARAEGRAEDEGWRRRKDGTLFWANVVITAVTDAQGRFRGYTHIARDLTERRKTGQEIRRLQQFQAAILAATGSAIVVIGEDGHITLTNPAAERLLGRQAADLVGRFGPEVFHRAEEVAELARSLDCAETVSAVLAALAGGDGREWTYVRGDGSTVPVLAAWTRPTETIEGAALILSAHDISARKALETDLKRSNQDLEHFAYVASHDLRQPLRMVNSYLTLLRRRLGDGLDDDCREFIGYAVDGAQRMDRMIIDLLDYSRIGRNSHHSDRVDLIDMVDLALANLRLAIADAQADIVVRPGLPVVPGYASELERLFQNLIANAIKFRRPDIPPRVEIGWTEADGEWRIRVADNGIGIEADQQDRLFTIFHRGAPAQYEGNGIGLAACRKIVERHGGRIWVESRPGQGTTFHIALPR